MARTMGDKGEAFRAVITRTSTKPDGTVTSFTTYEGPYASVGTAKAQVTRAKRLNSRTTRNAWDGSTTVWDGFVEKAATTWEPVDSPVVERVTITAAEYEALKLADAELDALHEWGVDNWEGYGDALAGRSPDE